MSLFEEASLICRGKNITWETVLLFFNNMPKKPMLKTEFHQYMENKLKGWKQTHSQIARQLAFYYEDRGVCYPRFTEETTFSELFMYMQNWATKYFVPNPFTPSLKDCTPTTIYTYIVNSIKEGKNNFDEILDSMFNRTLNNCDKVNVYLSNFAGLIIDNNHNVFNCSNKFVEVELHPLEIYATDARSYYDYFDPSKSVLGDNCNYVGQSLQQIFYGAPGTGKSHRINEITSIKPKENVFRTTFHPDSDYSTFVGSYKPIKEQSDIKQPLLDYDSLVDKLKEYLAIQPVNITYGCTLFGYNYHDSIVEMQNNDRHSISSLVTDAYKSGSSFDTNIRSGMIIYEKEAKNRRNSSITYTFVPQAFTKAYMRAWQTKDPVYLIIEEINRGNCAQIFGDLFQLLDRKNGQSEYPIKPDSDLSMYISENMTSPVENTPESVKQGEEMILPPNLYIWATMNTSDQSLFPIDSAFKRRWDWQYIPIANANEDYYISVDNYKFDWWIFLEKINQLIGETTSSEDKKLGYFFCKPKDKEIDVNMFVSKVIFYLWNDVFKDFEFSNSVFDDVNGKLTFGKFYKSLNKETIINEDKVVLFLNNLDVAIDKENSMLLSNNPAEAESAGNDFTNYSLNGSVPMGKSALGLAIIEKYLKAHPELNFSDIKKTFPDTMLGSVGSKGLIVENDKDFGSYIRYYAQGFKSSDGVEFKIFKQWTVNNIQSIIDFAKAQGWTVEVKGSWRRKDNNS